MSRLAITLKPMLLQRFYKTVPKGHRAQYAANAIQEALDKEDKLHVLKAIQSFKRFDVRGSSEDVIRAFRDARGQAIVEQSRGNAND